MLPYFILAIAFSAVTMWRIRLLVRFFQLEEYQNKRFLLWLRIERIRWLPNFWLIGFGIGTLLSFISLILSIESSILYLIIWIIAAAIMAYTPPTKEVKKRFVATARAKRLLATAFILAISLNCLSAILIEQGDNLLLMGILGSIVVLCAPLLLPIANLAMYPVEATLRRGFIAKARRRLKEAQVVVIGITGSYGKTSTKQYLTHILSGRYKVISTPKSYNTLMGVCITINNDLDPTAGYQYFVCEMGAYVPGEIRRICELTKPQMSIVIAVGPQHLERFGSLENIEKAKYEIVEGVPPNGITAFNFDDERVRRMETRQYPQHRFGVSCSTPPHPDARLIAENIKHTKDGLLFDVTDRQTNETRTFRTELVGLHNVTNILLATVIALETGMKLSEIALRVTSLTPADHRLRRTTLPNGITMLDDAYNTNPVGAANALEVLGLYQEGRRVLVTPGMVELADIQDIENEKLGRAASRYCTDIILVGKKQTEPIAKGVLSTDFDPNHLLIVDTVQEAIDWYQANLQSGDTILFLNDLADNYLR
ncbi:MAG: hypothetical protein CUN55_08515 [Phototrophicales bacterium]|nr:MAG: hypothetical protein CUN55_08515 [Phototrophicales bacterium]